MNGASPFLRDAHFDGRLSALLDGEALVDVDGDLDDGVRIAFGDLLDVDAALG
jgi:hypothetical protein